MWTTTTSPDRSVYRPTYNEANLLDRIDAVLRGAEHDGKGAWTPFVTNISYNARGQRTQIVYANGADTAYEYDPETFRLTGLRTARSHEHGGFAKQVFTDPGVVQDLRYTYDPVGNITQIVDASLRTVFHDNCRVDPASRYTYDPLYRLVEATGRENFAQSMFEFSPPRENCRDYPLVGALQLHDPLSLQNCVERYEYDPVGNFRHMIHRAKRSAWTRHYTYQEESLIEPLKHSNRLSHTQLESVSVPQLEPYLHDAHGNIVQMPHLPVMQWDFMDRLRATSQQVVNCGIPEITFCVYDGDGQRVRKVTERHGGSRKNERLYLGRFEVHREYERCEATRVLERETLHVLDDKRRIAVVETLTVDQRNAFFCLESMVRYQLANHLESASLELDETGGLISYEEYAPYGNTVYQAGRNAAEVSLKRYRYTGQERDEESGFTYHEARYYAPWLGRWTSCDPGKMLDGPNLYLFVRCNPETLVDPSGKNGEKPPTVGWRWWPFGKPKAPQAPEQAPAGDPYRTPAPKPPDWEPPKPRPVYPGPGFPEPAPKPKPAPEPTPEPVAPPTPVPSPATPHTFPDRRRRKEPSPFKEPSPAPAPAPTPALPGTPTPAPTPASPGAPTPAPTPASPGAPTPAPPPGTPAPVPRPNPSGLTEEQRRRIEESDKPIKNDLQFVDDAAQKAADLAKAAADSKAAKVVLAVAAAAAAVFFGLKGGVRFSPAGAPFGPGGPEA